jgi:hypothetical protein
VLGEAGATSTQLNVVTDVTLGPDPAGGFRIRGIKLTVRGTVEGVDEAGFLRPRGGQDPLHRQQGPHRHRHHPRRRPRLTTAPAA